MERNALAPESVVSCIFTATNDLDAEFPAVAARALGFDAVPLLCAREIPVPRAMPRVIRVLIHYYAADDHEPTHVYLGEARALRADLSARAVACTTRPGRHGAAIGPMAIEFSERIRRIPVYPAAGGYAQDAPLVRLASNESPYPPLPAVREAIERALADAQPLPGPLQLAAARAGSASATGCPASRIAIGNGSCDILLAAGEALLEPGAELVYAWPSFSVYPHLSAASGARAVTVPLDAQRAPRPRRRCCARSPSPRGW